MTDLNELLKRLLKSDVDFVLVGGFAGVVHGAAQVTQDIDICIAINEFQITKLREGLKDLNPRHRMNPKFKPSFLTHPEDLSNVKNIYLETDFGVLDIMHELAGVGDFERVSSQAIKVNLFDHEVKVISLEDLIEIKKNLSRAKDKALYHELLEIKKLKSK